MLYIAITKSGCIKFPSYHQVMTEVVTKKGAEPSDQRLTFFTFESKKQLSYTDSSSTKRTATEIAESNQVKSFWEGSYVVLFIVFVGVGSYFTASQIEYLNIAYPIVVGYFEVVGSRIRVDVYVQRVGGGRRSYRQHIWLRKRQCSY